MIFKLTFLITRNMVLDIDSNSLVNYGTLTIGIGTFFLALVLGIITVRGTNRDRKVHIADKRQEWINTFRNQIAEVLSVQTRILFQYDDFSYDQLQNILRELNTLTNQVRFMFQDGDINRTKLENSFDNVFKALKDKDSERVVSEHKKIIAITDSILKIQSNKIVMLDNADPLT